MRYGRSFRTLKKLALYFIVAVAFIGVLIYILWLDIMNGKRQDVDLRIAEIIIQGWEPTRNLSNVKTYIRPEENTTLLFGRNVCPSFFPPELLLIVCSSIKNVEYRSAIRNTWGYNSTRLYNINVIFMVGISRDETIMEQIKTENLENGDLIVENCVDSKYNNTLKSIFMLKWATQNCKSAKFIMKTVDDAFINIANLARFIDSPLKMRSRSLVGKLYANQSAIRDSNFDRYMPEYMYPYERYPDYLSGAGYLMTMETAKLLYEKSLITSFVHLEDVFITGLCAQAAQVIRYHDFRFYYVDRFENHKFDCDIEYQRNLIVHSYGLKIEALYKNYEELRGCSS